MVKRQKRELPPLVPLKLKNFLNSKIKKICEEEGVKDSSEIEIIQASFIQDLENKIEESKDRCPIRKRVGKLTRRIYDHIDYMKSYANEITQYC